MSQQTVLQVDCRFNQRRERSERWQRLAVGPQAD